MKYFKNLTATSADFYVYGEIVDEKVPDWWTGEVSATEIDTAEMRAEIEELQTRNITELNIYINSPGGSVFASSTMVSLLKRFKQNNGKIHGYVDGLCASAATYLLMVADDINVYQNSIMMVHKPMTFSIGNANDLQKDIDTLNTIENDMMIPMYMTKALVDEDTLKALVNAETWFSGNQSDDKFIGNFFDINFLDEAKEVAACASKRLFKSFKNVPDNLIKEEPKNGLNKRRDGVKPMIDYSEYENVIDSLKGGNE